jgi:hypothetical protein
MKMKPEVRQTMRSAGQFDDAMSDRDNLARVGERLLAHLYDDADDIPDGQALAQALLTLGGLLIAKNKAYGGSALEPLPVFSRLGTEDRLAVRMDDKIARLARGTTAAGEDAVLDLAGYLVLLLAAQDAR